jgi:hypothetical protein
MLPADIFLFFYSSTSGGLHLGVLRKKQEKCVYNPADLEVALPEIQGGIFKIEAARVKYSAVHSRFSIEY